MDESLGTIADKCINLGFMVDASQTNAINPAYIISESQIDQFVNTLDEVLKKAE